MSPNVTQMHARTLLIVRLKLSLSFLVWAFLINRSNAAQASRGLSCNYGVSLWLVHAVFDMCKEQIRCCFEVRQYLSSQTGWVVPSIQHRNWHWTNKSVNRFFQRSLCLSLLHVFSMCFINEVYNCCCGFSPSLSGLVWSLFSITCHRFFSPVTAFHMVYLVGILASLFSGVSFVRLWFLAATKKKAVFGLLLWHWPPHPPASLRYPCTIIRANIKFPNIAH